MNYSTDKPIETTEQDLLGRAFFSSQLGKAIYEYNGKDGLVVGLFGKWGTGKTSVINMTVNEINKLAENNKNKLMTMIFSPWNYSDKDNLISLFFQKLKNKIGVQDNEKFKSTVGKALSDYSGAFDALSIIPVVGSGVAALLKTVAQAEGANLMQGVDLDETRETLEKALIEADMKIIVMIDDIDRLTNSQIRDIFQLVKQVADFPNVIYVLSMDREVVCRALTEVHNIDGNQYLEKIIQVPFELPELRKTKLHDIFFTKLNQIISDIHSEVVLDQEYWGNVFDNCIKPYINTLRDVNRLINIFQFKYGLVYQETSFEDMLGLTTLEVFEPELYKWISSNKNAVCRGFEYRPFSRKDNEQDYYKFYYDEFKNLGINPDLAISCVSTMFPVFAKDVNKYSYQRMSDIRGNMRVAYEGRFELYFVFDFDDIKVSRSRINACLYEFNEKELRKNIENINNEGNIIFFLEEIRYLVEQIPYARLSLIASVILSLQGRFKGETLTYIYRQSASDIAEYLFDDIIKRLKTEEEKYQIIRSAVDNIHKSELGTTAKIINRMEFAYGRLNGKLEEDKQIISLEHLKELEKIYVKRIQDIANSESILDINRLNIALHLWESFDQDGVIDYIERLFKNKVNKLKFICSMAGRWSGTNGSGWWFNSEEYSKYILPDEVYKTIQTFDKSKLDAFTEDEQKKLATFVLNYNKGEMDHANEQEALQLVNQWKEEKEE